MLVENVYLWYFLGIFAEMSEAEYEALKDKYDFIEVKNRLSEEPYTSWTIYIGHYKRDSREKVLDKFNHNYYKFTGILG